MKIYQKGGSFVSVIDYFETYITFASQTASEMNDTKRESKA